MSKWQVLWGVAFGHVRQTRGGSFEMPWWGADFSGVDVTNVVHRLDTGGLITLNSHTLKYELTELGRAVLTTTTSLGQAVQDRLTNG